MSRDGHSPLLVPAPVEMAQASNSIFSFQSQTPSLVNQDRNPPPPASVAEGASTFPEKSAASEAVIPTTISKWSVGKTTIFYMSFFYLLSFIIAIIHLVLFHYLDGRSADNTQTYVSTASNLLAFSFAASIKIALATAFAQHLWFMLRQSSLKISTIETLFNIRSNPLQLFHIVVLKTTWILVLLAIVLYIIPIATSFPPGALTVKSTSPGDTVLSPVPTFNASSVGNGTIGSAVSSAVNPLAWNIEFTSNSTFAMTLWSSVGVILLGSLQRLATSVVVSGEPLAMPSPCGPNCSYTIEFEGPIFDRYSSARNFDITHQSSFGDELGWEQEALELESSYFHEGIFGNSTNQTSSILKAPPLFFGGTWNYPGGVPTIFGPNMTQTESQGVYTEASFDITTLKSTDFLAPPITVTEANVSCIPSRALYTVKNSYTDNIQNLTYSTGPPTQLLNTRSLVLMNGTYSGTSGPDFPLGQLVGNWTDENLVWYRDCQLMALIEQVAYVFNGTYLMNTFYSNQTGTLEQVSSLLGGVGPASNFVINSRLNTAFQNYDLSFAEDSGDDSAGTFNVTQEALNKMVGDLTISAMIAYGLWSDTVNVTKFPSENVYTFSQPVNLLIPYFLTLVLSLPFLFIGTFALYRNGVPAADGGFIQILSTTTGSQPLLKAAVGNCLGGEEISTELKDLEVQFGELIDNRENSGGRLIRRAGFGTKGEVGPLVKGEKYGYS